MWYLSRQNSAGHTLFPCLGTLLISGPVSNITSVMKGPFPWVGFRSGKLPLKAWHVGAAGRARTSEEPA